MTDRTSQMERLVGYFAGYGATHLIRLGVDSGLFEAITAQPNGITAADLAMKCVAGIPCKADERMVRKAVVDLRLAGHHICAQPSSGYYIALTDAELNSTIKFLFRRAMKSLTQVAAMKRVSLPDLAGQLNLQLDNQELK